MRGILDTGFTGFVQIPFLTGITLGLQINPALVGKTTLANGNIQNVLFSQTTVIVNQEPIPGLCQMPVSGNCPLLIGMDFFLENPSVFWLSQAKWAFIL